MTDGVMEETRLTEVVIGLHAAEELPAHGDLYLSVLDDIETVGDLPFLDNELAFLVLLLDQLVGEVVLLRFAQVVKDRHLVHSGPDFIRLLYDDLSNVLEEDLPVNEPPVVNLDPEIYLELCDTVNSKLAVAFKVSVLE